MEELPQMPTPQPRSVGPDDLCLDTMRLGRTWTNMLIESSGLLGEALVQPTAWNTELRAIAAAARSTHLLSAAIGRDYVERGIVVYETNV